MKKFVYIKGVHFENKGAELMLRTIEQKINEDKALSNIKIVLTCNGASPYELRARMGAYQYFSLSRGPVDLNFLMYLVPSKIRNWLFNNYGIVSEPDLYAILDASGYAYGDKWSIRPLQRTCSQLRRFYNKGKKYIFMPQAFGPFEKKDSIDLLKRSFPLATKIYAREKISYSWVVKSIGQSKLVDVAPDFTNLFRVETNGNNENETFIVIPNSNMVSNRSGNKLWKEKYIDIICSVIQEALDKGLRVVVVNHEGESDANLCDEIANNYKGRVEVMHGLNAYQIKCMIAEAKMVFSSRYHGCVSALSQGKLCFGTSWSHKYEELYSEYGVRDLLLSSPDDFEKSQEVFSKAFETVASYESKITDKGNEIKLQSMNAWKEIADSLA